MEKMLGSCEGQSTLEYALVLCALLASVVALGAVLAFIRNPAVFSSVIDSSAHVLSGGDALGTAFDVVVF